VTGPTWKWITVEVALAIHDRQLAEHGGGEGMGDQGLVEAALARPQQRAAYDSPAPDAAALAAAYTIGIAKNHGFVDGNKRTAWVVCRLFLALNGIDFRFDKVEAVKVMEKIAAGEVTEEEFSGWLRDRTLPLR